MADATATISINSYPTGVSNDQRWLTIRGTISLSQGHYPIGGFPLTWNQEQLKVIPQNSSGTIQPIDMDVHSVGFVKTTAGQGPSGYIYLWDNVQGNLHIFESNNGVSTNSGPLVELGAAALPAAVFQDTISFVAVFTRE